ncbi:MAG: hypothetical protein JST54_35400 [Deltaproteobacteria bacterium]|nr:hypothetical protein [Deltaproteobacteria bacterium]
MRIVAVCFMIVLSLVFGRSAHADPDLEAGPLHLDFKVDAPDHKSPVASGSMEMEAQHTSKFEVQSAGEPGKLALEFFSRIHHDGTVAVWVGYEEVGAKGERVSWEPAMQGKRGAPLTATIRAGQVERTITVTVR